MATDKAALVAAVRAHASENYETGGWDYVIECWSDEDILRTIEGAKTERGAIKKAAGVVRTLNDRRLDVEAEVF